MRLRARRDGICAPSNVRAQSCTTQGDGVEFWYRVLSNVATLNAHDDKETCFRYQGHQKHAACELEWCYRCRSLLLYWDFVANVATEQWRSVSFKFVQICWLVLHFCSLEKVKVVWGTILGQLQKGKTKKNKSTILNRSVQVLLLAFKNTRVTLTIVQRL